MCDRFVIESLIKLDGRNTVCVLRVAIRDTFPSRIVVYTIILRRYSFMRPRNPSVSREVEHYTAHIMAMCARANSGSTSPPSFYRLPKESVPLNRLFPMRFNRLSIYWEGFIC